jgi:hypothetical protein
MEKTLTFQRPSFLQSQKIAIECVFPFSLVDSSLIGMPEEKSRTSQHQVKVTASFSLIAAWGFPITADQQTKHNTSNLQIVLFEYGKRYVVQKLKTSNNLALEEELDLNASKAELPCPFDPSLIQDPDGAIIKVAVDTSDIQPKYQKHVDLDAMFVDLNRIEELRAIKSTQFDLAKLIRFCEELNICYENECYLAVTMLTRALIDHVAPILGFNLFTEVVNNYKGTRYFKEQMEHLQNSSRKISDAQLHTRIRSQEILPNRIQVNFANDIDVLLAEIVRVLK